MTYARRRRLAFWGTTGIFAGLMIFSGVLYLSGAPMIRQTLAHLGYPGYLLVILGTAKLVGAIALVQNRVPILREWAYAGFTIDLVGAIASHLFSGDPVAVAAVPAVFLLVLALSYALRPEPRVPMITRPDRHVGVAA
jgi:energy-converting hydrogenase Eha subunit C